MNTKINTAAKSEDKATSLVTTMAEKFGVDPVKFYQTLAATAFKQRDGSAPSTEQMLALLVVADQYGLNPFTKEIYAFPDKQNGIIPVVGVDGWSRIINNHPALDGIEFNWSEETLDLPGAKAACPAWVEAVIYRKDRTKPTVVREHLDESYRAPFKGKYGDIDGPWQSHPKRMIRHKALIQCARYAFGFVGIVEADEAERILEARNMGEAVVVSKTHPEASSAPVVSEPLQLGYEEKQKLDPLLQRIADRAKESDSWTMAHDYVENRYEAAELVYAVQFLRDAELEAMEPPASRYEDGGNTTFVEDCDEAPELNVSESDDHLVDLDDGYFSN